MPIVAVDDLRTFAEQAFIKGGVPLDEATLIADVLIEADLRGVHSHGAQNLPRWARGFLRGFLPKHIDCPLVVDAGALCVLDAEGGSGAVASNKAMDIAMERAAQFGVAMVSVKNSSHFGMAAYYTMKALDHDQIGFCTTNGPAVMAPWGGCDSLLCNNPFSYAIPAGDEPPVVLDMACSAVARGRIRLMARDGSPIPEGWAITRNGVPTIDPALALEGSVLPFGGYKGYGIAVINELLSAGLASGLFSYEISRGERDAQSEIRDQTQTSWRCSHLIGALDVGKLTDVRAFKRRVDELSRTLKASAKAEGSKRIYMPGEIEHDLRVERLASGIPLSQATIDLLYRFAVEEAEIAPLAVSAGVASPASRG